jgi:hypothetical protein
MVEVDVRLTAARADTVEPGNRTESTHREPDTPLRLRIAAKCCWHSQDALYWG